MLAVFTVILGCRSVPDDIPPDLSKAEIFQRAQEASDQEHWERAVAYYKEFIERFQEDPGAVAEARYEIAFLTYKMGNLEEALALFNDLLTTYEGDTGGELPAWPRVLSEKLVGKIQGELQPSGETVVSEDS
jgi:outer membrane protein assembly factor BamD (BamD/ComL family)